MSGTCREVVTLQLGHYSNFIGTHWWNLQDAALVYDSDFPASELQSDVMFREGLTLGGHVTYTPRLIAMDLKGSLQTLRKEGNLYDTENENTAFTWEGQIRTHKESPPTKNAFLQELDNLDTGGLLAEADFTCSSSAVGHCSGVHTNQVMYGCEIDDDGTKRGYNQHGYDGEDFLTLDMSTLTWTAANDKAMITKVKWDSTGAEAMQWKGYLENTCIEWLQKYVDYGKDTLQRKVSPEVFLQQKSSSSQVTCLATGFYPKAVTISWQKNGQDHDEDVDLGELLPNEDGTFQRTSTLKVSPDERKKNAYSCVVEHQRETFRKMVTDDSLPLVEAEKERDRLQTSQCL
ncbi:hypothetical protein QQF64_012940 [Cirrhinus molitorella]|uniref:Ig-like domain-containing protein n=1 Tax=Cirrhinus molitorella TaxID=172907 RepID=A0ABR3LT64_9TELE